MQTRFQSMVGRRRERRGVFGLIPLGLAFFLMGAGVGDLPPLIKAAKSADWQAVQNLLDQGTDVNTVALDGATALQWASYWDDVETAKLLIGAGADVNAVNDLGAGPLWIASLNASSEMVRTLLEAGADPNAPLLAGESPIMTAARSGDPEVVQRLLAAGADANVSGVRGQTALMWAAGQQHSDVIGVLLEYGADIHARSDTWTQVMAVPPHASPANRQAVPHGGNTALTFAARVGDLTSARMLINAGANVNDADARGISVLVLAAHSGFEDLVEFVLQQGADPNAAEGGFSALHMAIMRRDEGVARFLLDHDADANARITNWTPTRRASRDWYFHPSMVGATPLWLAARLTQPGVMRLLVDHGADPLFVHEVTYVGGSGSFGSDGMKEATTTLMAAVGMGGPRRLRGYMGPDPDQVEALTLEAAQFAVELGVDVNATDLEGQTVMDSRSFQSVMDFLAVASTR
jgi:ankyrin repeat protein